MTEVAKSAVPLDLDEYPGLRVEYARRLTSGSWLASCFTIVPGYLVFFEFLRVTNAPWKDFLLRSCSSCTTRYQDLQRYDGVSGDVYLLTVSFVILCTIALSFALILTYFKARMRSGTHFAMKPGVGRQITFIVVLIVGLLFSLVLLPTDLSSTKYPGSAQLLAGATFPILAGFCTVALSLAITHLGVFFLKLFRF